MSISQVIRELREERGMKQEQLADRAGLTQATISRIESGRVEQLKSDALKRLADALHVTMDYLVGRTSEVSVEELLASDPEAASLLEVYRRLSPDDRSRVLEYARFLSFTGEMDLEQLGRLRDLIGESGDLRGVDRQVAILRALADLTDSADRTRR